MNRNPVLVQGRRFHLVYFGLFAACGGWAGMWVAARYLHLNGFSLDGTGIFLFPVLALTCWFSARAAHFVALGRKFLEAPGRYVGETAFYVQGGIFGLLFSSVVFAAWTEIPLGVFWDALALGAFPALTFGRLGCFNYGCCHGRPTSLPWGVVYHNPHSKVIRLKPELKGVKLHPAQLYTAVLNAAAFPVALFLAVKNLPPGTVAAFFLIYHGTARIFVDRFRDLRNWRGAAGTPPATAAWFTLFLGILIPLLAPFHGASPQNSFSAAAMNSGVLFSITTASLILFLGYGVHGKKVGYFLREPAE